MTDILFPAAIPIVAETWAIDARTRGGGATITGQEQIAYTPWPRWRASVTVNAYGRYQQLYQTIIDRMQGRAGTLLIGPRSWRSATADGILWGDDPADLTWAGGITWRSLAPQMTALTEVAAGGTAVTLNTGAATNLQPGMVFAVDHGGEVGRRIYRVHTAMATAQGRWSVEFLPAARGAITIGQAIHTGREAYTSMQLVTDDSGVMATSRRGLEAATLELVERFIPAVSA